MLECNTNMFLTGWDSVHYEIHIFPAGFVSVSLHFWDWIWTYNNPSGFLQLLLPMSAVTSVDWFSGSEMDAWSGSWSTLRSSSLTSCWLWLRSERSSENSSSSLRNTHTHTHTRHDEWEESSQRVRCSVDPTPIYGSAIPPKINNNNNVFSLFPDRSLCFGHVHSWQQSGQVYLIHLIKLTTLRQVDTGHFYCIRLEELRCSLSGSLKSS